jgi:hypothetical protein
MNNPIATGVGSAEQVQPRRQSRFATGEEPERQSYGEQFKAENTPMDPPIKMPKPEASNPYAPTGWRRKQRSEFDLELPSGQLCRVLRLEREDLFRLNLMSYLDTFTPMLMEDSISSEQRNQRMRETMTKHPDSIANMFMAIDEVVMASCIKPKISNDESQTDYGGPTDWGNPQFVATAYIEDISMEDRMAIFAAAFGRSMDDLKSLWGQAGSVGSLADEPGVQQNSE